MSYKDSSIIASNANPIGVSTSIALILSGLSLFIEHPKLQIISTISIPIISIVITNIAIYWLAGFVTRTPAEITKIRQQQEVINTISNFIENAADYEDVSDWQAKLTIEKNTLIELKKPKSHK